MKPTARRVPTRYGRRLVRPLVRKLHAYVPGEQPKIPGLVKLNTNENPYPPSPAVLAALSQALGGRLRLYPNPTAQPLREKLARMHRCSPENIVIGNGSDDLLALATRAFVEPAPGTVARAARSPRSAGLSRSTIQYFTPSYSLYPVLAAIQGAITNPVELSSDWGLPANEVLRQKKRWDFNAALSYITTPNAPTSRGYSTADLDRLCRVHRGVIVLDEAYVDFADENALALALKHPHVLVARTFSKAYSLCFLRVGYFVGSPVLISALDKVRDSYNVNGLGQIAAEATLDDLPYYRSNFRRIIATRDRLTTELRSHGFEVSPSQTNFVFTRPPEFPAGFWRDKLRRHKILVRWFDAPRVRDYLRITIGSDAEIDALLRAVDTVIAASRQSPL